MDALYFPHLSLPASAWVNPALLYFDQLGVIAPDGRRADLHDRRTSELFDLDLARPVVARWRDSEDSDDRFVAFVLGLASRRRSHGQIARIHAGKLAYSDIGNALLAAGLLLDGRDGWLEGPEWVIAHVMCYVALQLSASAHGELALVTDETGAAEVVGGPRASFQGSRRLRALTSLLPVPPDARPADIDRFRRTHRAELQIFRDYVTQLVTRDSATDEGEVKFGDRLEEAEKARDHLLGEMSSFNWKAHGPVIAIAAFSAAAPLAEHSPFSFAAGLLGLGLASVQAAQAYRRGHRAAKSPLIYATKVSAAWPPNAQRALR